MDIRCPVCRKKITTSADIRSKGTEEKFFPFCSERCRLIDLGAWLDEKYRIPAEDTRNPSE